MRSFFVVDRPLTMFEKEVVKITNMIGEQDWVFLKMFEESLLVG